MFKTLCTTAALAACSLPAQAVVLAEWNFDSFTAPTSATTTFGGIASSASVGLLASGSVFHRTPANFSTPAGNGSARSFSADNWSVGDYFQFVVSTVGYTSLIVDFDQSGNATGPRDFSWSYSLDAITFWPLAQYTVAQGAWTTSATATGYSHNLTVPLEAANSPTVFLKMTSASTVAIGGGTVAANGISSIDNVRITASPVPEPESAALWLAGLGAAGLVRQRRPAGRPAV